MHSTPKDEGASCPGRCPVCSKNAPASVPPEGDTGPYGWPLVGWSAAVFLLPVLAGVAGAAWAGPGSRGAAGGLAGFAAGVAVAALLHRIRLHPRAHP